MNGDEEDFEAYRPGRTQQVLLSFLMFPSGILSIIGSSYIIRAVLADKKSSPYRRIMLALSIWDIVATIGYLLQPFLGPVDSPYAYTTTTIGNDASCTFLGTMTQLSFASQWYAGALSFYFVSTVRYGVSEVKFAKKYEKWIHGIIFSFHVITSVVGVVGDVFHQRRLNIGCWVADSRDGTCSGMNCHAELVAYCFAGFPLIGMLFFVIISNSLLYTYVKRTIVEGQRKAMEAEKRLQMYQKQQQEQQRQQDSSDNTPTKEEGGRNQTRNVEQPIEPRGNVMISSDKQWKRIRQVRLQALLYVLAYLASFIWSAMINILEGRNFAYQYKDSGRIYFPLMVLQSLFLPSQGLLNAMVFFRPKFAATRAKYPKQTRSWCVRRSIYGERIKPVACVEQTTRGVVKNQNNNEQVVANGRDPSLVIPKQDGVVSEDEASVSAVDESERYFSSGRKLHLEKLASWKSISG